MARSKIRIRATLNGTVAEVKALMRHPMETGMRKDPKTGEKIPAHHIKTVTATCNDRVVLEAHWGGAVSANPFLAFNVDDVKAGDVITVSWEDNKGETDSNSAPVK